MSPVVPALLRGGEAADHPADDHPERDHPDHDGRRERAEGDHVEDSARMATAFGATMASAAGKMPQELDRSS